MSTPLLYADALKSCPPLNQVADARQQIHALNRAAGVKLVVIDDDPTGCQTVHDTKILLDWDKNRISRCLAATDCFYILTNSRAYPAHEARRINRDLAQLLKKTAGVGAPRIQIVSRSDSTLRGHFYEEVSALAEVLGPYDGLLIAPFFAEGGRLTLHDVHYVRQGDALIPAHETEFAKDRTFGYNQSNLGDWVAEKSAGRWRQEDAISLTLEGIRTGGSDWVFEKLLTAKNMQPVVINALVDGDLEIVVLGLERAEAEGKRFLYRTAASFVKVRAGMADTALCQSQPLGGRGLVVVGSHVQKTTEQLAHLLSHAPVVAVEVALRKILSGPNESYRQQILHKVEQALRDEQPVVVFTERKFLREEKPEDQLAAGKRVSDFLSNVVRSLSVRPDFVIAKGGITSHDTARQGLLAGEATVRGQVAPGVPLWTLEEGKCPGLPYVVFPGNVGEPGTLTEVFDKFWRKAEMPANTKGN